MQASHLNSAGKLALNSNRELAERNLDVSPGALPINATSRLDKSPTNFDHRSIAAKIALGSSLIEFESDELCQIHKGESIIAMDTNQVDGALVLGCNKCVFEKKLQKPVFLAF